MLIKIISIHQKLIFGKSIIARPFPLVQFDMAQGCGLLALSIFLVVL